jgi:hypothetical protein
VCTERVQRREITECHAGAERYTRRGVLATHDRVHIVAARVQARERSTFAVEQLRMLVGAQAQARAQIGRRKLQRRLSASEPLPKSASSPDAAYALMRCAESRRPSARRPR